MKKFLAMLLAVMMVMSMATVFAEDAPAAAEDTAVVEEAPKAQKGEIIYGTTTEIGGDFAPSSWWTNNATDKMVREMTNDYSTVVSNQGGEYVINSTVADTVEGVMNDDGTKTYTVKIKEGLTYNNGEAITIKDFVWSLIFSCSKVSMDVGAKMTGYMTFVGGQEYYDGTATAVSGIRILDDYTVSMQIVKDKVPYFFDITYAGITAYSLGYWLGEGFDVVDDGEGAYITGNFTAEGITTQLDYARFNAGPDRVSAGPYNLIEFDKAALQATFVINENYAGNFEGQKPSIEKIVFLKAEDATWADSIKTGAFNFYDTITDGSQINTALDIIEAGGFEYVQFDRAGYGMINFQCDFGPTQFRAVRYAIGLLLDRNEFANTFCQGWGGVVSGPYGTGLWQYQQAEEWIDESLNTYNYNPEEAVATLVADGWVLDATGADYVSGIRYKKVTEEEAGNYAHNVTLDDEEKTVLMPLIIEWSSSEKNAVSELLKVMLASADATISAGVQINQNEMTFTELLNYYYRDSSQGEKYAVPTYGMFNLASNFTPAYDQSYEWTLDPEKVAQGYNLNRLYDEKLDKLSMDMVFGVDPTDTEGYMELWKEYVLLWNEHLPQVPLYSNVYITMYPDWLEGYTQDSFWDFNQAILYCTVAE